MDIVTKMNRIAQRGEVCRVRQKVSEILWIERAEMLALDLNNWNPPNLRTLNIPVEFSLGGVSDILNIISDTNLNLEGQGQKEYYLKLLQDENRLVVGRLNGNVIYYLWAVLRYKKTFNKYFILGPDEAFMARLFVRKEYRGQGLATHGRVFILQQLKQQGIAQVFADITSYDSVALSRALKAGYKLLDSYFYRVRLLFRDYIFSRGPLSDRYVNKQPE